jgi:uncharacterized protein
LLPIQLSVLGVSGAAVTSTNLLFNVAATPGALLRFWQEHRLLGPLGRLLVAGSVPGVIVGAVLRVELLSSQRTFMFVAACVLLPLGLWLLLGGQRVAPSRPRMSARRKWLTCGLALIVGVVGGIYGIGGGSLLAPVLLASGFSAYELAPATLLATFVTSVVGVAAFQVLELLHGGSIAPDWALGVWIGAGGFVGSYLGARRQQWLPETSIRRLLGLVACLVAVGYVQVAARQTSERQAHARTL